MFQWRLAVASQRGSAAGSGSAASAMARNTAERPLAGADLADRAAARIIVPSAVARLATVLSRAVAHRAPAWADLELAGLALHGPRNAVDKVCQGATLHP